jgi:hypothetical protein
MIATDNALSAGWQRLIGISLSAACVAGDGLLTNKEKNMNQPRPFCRARSIRGHAFALALAVLVAQPVQANPANQSAPWRLNGNGYPGEVTVQQAADGTLSGSIYGNPLTGFYSPGERIGVWLRGAPTQPDQAFVGQATPDGMSFAGRFYGLNTTASGATAQRNVFAFTALRAAPSHPDHPGVPNAAAGPASVAGTLPLVANGHAGQLVLSQAPDGSLSGSLYGDRLTGHYAQGTGSIAFLRFTGAQPVQLYIGNVSAQGINGEFYALTVPAGGSAQRMRYSWSAQAPQGVQGAAATPVASLTGATALLARPGVTTDRATARGVPLAPSTACGSVFARPCATAVNPASVRLQWAAHAQATHYRVLRGQQMLTTVPSTAREFIDDQLDPGASATYTVQALRAEGQVSLSGVLVGDAAPGPGAARGGGPSLTRFATLESSEPAAATTPRLDAPGGVTAQAFGGPKGQVRVAWAPVAGANGYLVYRNGNPLPVDPRARQSNSFYDTGVPLGRHGYIVEALFTTAGQRTVNGAGSAPAMAEVAFPRPSAPFLALGGQPSDARELDAHYRTRCSGPAAQGDINDCAKIRPILQPLSNWDAVWAFVYGGPSASPQWPLVQFADVGTLGLGRRVNCVPRSAPTAPVVCWATSHGSIPPPGTTPDGAALAAAAQSGANMKSINLIMVFPDGRAFFGTWELQGTPAPSGGGSPFAAEEAFAGLARVRFGTQLDNQGVKPVPHACLACHGGRYDPVSKLVVGASLLPLVPSQLHFSSPQARAAQEEAIRQINEIVLSSNPAPAVVAQIEAMYGGATRTPGARANDTAVPAGWRSDPAIYRQVIEPYCANCHFPRTGALSLASVNDARTLRHAIQNAVCRTYTMPHGEAQFRRFWTEGGPVSLPGLLSIWLGFDTCGP